MHDEAPRAEETDWHEIRALYELLHTLAPGPMVMLNRIVAIAMVDGAREALRRVTEAQADPALAGHHRVAAVRAHLLDMAGDHASRCRAVPAGRDAHAQPAGTKLPGAAGAPLIDGAAPAAPSLTSVVSERRNQPPGQSFRDGCRQRFR